MSPRRPRVLAVALLLAGACGGGEARPPEGGVEVPRDAGVAPPDRPASETADVFVPVAHTDGPADSPEPAGILDGAAGGEAGASPDPCAPASIVTLPVTAGPATSSGVLLGQSWQAPETPDCTAGATGPEVVFALAIPAGAFQLEASTVSATGTTADTVLYLRGACGGGRELACDDDAELPGPSRIAARVTGPELLYLVVDSFEERPSPAANAFSLTVSLRALLPGGARCVPPEAGGADGCGVGLVCPPAGGADATCATPTAPVIETVELFPQVGQATGESLLFLSARDGEGDWRSLRLACKDDAGVVLEEQDIDLADFWGEGRLAAMPFPLSLPAGSTSIEATVTDSTSLASGAAHAALTPWATAGQPCDAARTAPDACLGDLVCVGSACAASEVAQAACAGAPAIPLGTRVSGIAAELVSDAFEGSCCAERGGADRVFRVVLPELAGSVVAWDLVATTAPETTPYDLHSELDSYLYIRGACLDPATELACGDDVTDTDLRSEIAASNLAPGTYYLYLDTGFPPQNGSGAAYTLLARARAVLAPGAACTAGSAEHRCQTGSCGAATGTCR